MAPGAGRGAKRRRGNKPPVHKRRRGGGGASASRSDTSTLNVGANWKNRRRNRPAKSNRSTAAASDNRGTNGRRRTSGVPASALPPIRVASNGGTKARRRTSGAPDSVLPPIRVSSGGIMSTWKKPLGSLIRYYVYTRTNDQNVEQCVAEEEVDQMYYRSGCSVEDTKTMLLESLGVTRDIIQKGWVDMSMAIEKDGQSDVSLGYDETVDSKGIKLKQLLRAGEGPAHLHEQWTTIVVPAWAIGKSFFFEVKNYSPLNLSCELFLDGEKVAFNAPVLPNATSTIRPDLVRYYQRHQWILNDAKRVKLATSSRTNTFNGDNNGHRTLTTPRYNGIRPDYESKRVSLELYPDPTYFGWRFTGSVQSSRVEFFEKKMNIGSVKMDFYYTTGTIKTVLFHPTSGRNQLFRAQVNPEQYAAIMRNPRAHTGQGYRTNENRPTGQEGGDVEDEFDRMPPAEEQSDNGEEKMEEDTNFPYFARDDNYDFKRQGHRNRCDQMSKLQQSQDYADWKEANKKEYAVIHAKFYLSIPKRMYRAPKTGGVNQRRRVRQIEPLPVPQQAVVVDVKAAENATLGTKYKTTGPPQNMGRSSVRMERINGLTEDKDWKGEPVFETKLYYRSEAVVTGQGFGDDSYDGMSEDDSEEEVVVQDPTLDVYKSEKIDQVKQYYSELCTFMADEEEAEQRLRNIKNKIHLSESIKDVDDVVKLFYSDLTYRQVVEFGGKS